MRTFFSPFDAFMLSSAASQGSLAFGHLKNNQLGSVLMGLSSGENMLGPVLLSVI